MKNGHFDYIIAGAGAAGLSLAWLLFHSPLNHKRILIVDAEFHPKNSKTWCFWHRDDPPFADITTKAWKQIEICTNDRSIRKELSAYTYHCLNSKKFSNLILRHLEKHSSIQFEEGKITQMDGNEDIASITVNNTSYTADYIFQSCFIPPQIEDATPRFPLTQQFLGWDIESSQSIFDPKVVTLMDFDKSFNDGIAFIYILPWSPYKALVEYTIFSAGIYEQSFYEEKIRKYLSCRYNQRTSNFQIHRTEFGKIPMQDLPYAPWYTTRVLNIGTTGGLTKPSTGYTFTNIQRHSHQIVDQLYRHGKPAPPPQSSFRFRAYDLWLLHIIYDHPPDALKVFRKLFANNSADSIFQFLGEENSFWQDLQIMNSLPAFPFLRAIWSTKTRLFKI